MGKLNQVNRNVSMTLDKLPGIRGDLVRTNHLWESWNFLKLCEALHLWTRRDPLDSSQVDMLMGTSMAPLETYETSVTSVCGNFKMNVNLIKVEKGELLTIDNYEVVIAKYPHLKGVKVRD
ncbi:unnamed protein product [Porites lobata]|uniref:Uncharacterized protein n=1 Tax=Porites lobata TaxID=104759 RepID=A0ABN8MUK5_9CNID|nr:unnamed protein product [Porites lobata]